MTRGVPAITAADAATAVDLRPGGTEPPDGPLGAAPQPLIVDVRERDEFERERIAGVALVPISEFMARHAELPTDRPLLMLCHAGARSMSAAMFLLQHADADEPCPAGCGRTWSDVRNVTGGMISWRQAGLPVQAGAPAPDDGTLPTP